MITTKKGLLWRDGRLIELPEADRVAIAHGYMCAERMVKALETGAACPVCQRDDWSESYSNAAGTWKACSCGATVAA